VRDLTNGAPLDKRQCEISWSGQQADRSLSRQDRAAWGAYSSLHRVYLGLGYKLVHWKFVADTPTIINSYRLADISVGVSGTTYVLQQNSVSHLVTHKPALLGDTEVFVWVPYFNEFRHLPGDADFSTGAGHTSVSLCLKQKSNPTNRPASGHSYFTTLQEFERGI
jgi:hypothetical protein